MWAHSLAGEARPVRAARGAGAEGVDIEAAAAGVAGVNLQGLGGAVAEYICVDALDAVLVKVLVLYLYCLHLLKTSKGLRN